jgi:hypothetical protein
MSDSSHLLTQYFSCVLAGFFLHSCSRTIDTCPERHLQSHGSSACSRSIRTCGNPAVVSERASTKEQLPQL